ncbi:MAG: hypothetical protein MUP90_18740 [Gammaproteobacteria bacterium]|nr:hypothetical protein [Gammaproteobacteria bacterium]
MVDQALVPVVDLFTSPGLVLASTPLQAWLHLCSRAPAAQAARAIANSLGVAPGARVGSVSTLPGKADILTDGPGRWLLRYPFNTCLPKEIALCAVTDISDAMLGIRVSGDLALDLVASGCPLDLAGAGAAHPACARSLFHHIPLLLHRLEAQTLDLFVPRSYLPAFQHALLEAARGLVALHNIPPSR